jgi:hypothetical protein
MKIKTMKHSAIFGRIIIPVIILRHYREEIIYFSLIFAVANFCWCEKTFTTNGNQWLLSFNFIHMFPKDRQVMQFCEYLPFTGFLLQNNLLFACVCICMCIYTYIRTCLHMYIYTEDYIRVQHRIRYLRRLQWHTQTWEVCMFLLLLRNLKS